MILTFFLLSMLVLLADGWTNGWSTMNLFCVYRSSWRDPLGYIRLFGHVLGHANWEHFLNNMLLLLVVGPPMEEKYGSIPLLKGILFTALVTGVLQCVLGADEDVRDGDAVTVSGEAVRDERAPGGVELHAQRVKVLSRAAEAMPVPIGKNKMNLSLDTDLSLRFVTLRNLRKRAVFKIQEGIVRGFREALQKESIGGGWVTFSGKYCTEYGIATTAARMAHIVLHDEKAIMPASAELCGEYGESGLFAGVPCVLGANGVEQIVELPLTAEEQAQFHACCDGIRANMEHWKDIRNI